MTSSSDRTTRISELEMVSSAFLRLRATRGTRAYHEIPFLGRTIDLVFLRGTLLTSVEFKVSDWKRALKQARDHQLAADYSYICMPARRVSPEMRSALHTSGVGLFFFSPRAAWPFEHVLKARRSREKWAEAREALLQYVRTLATELA